jgi:hypothetical protein
MWLHEQTNTSSGVEILGIVKLPEGKVVEIVGEVHGADNKFCEQLIDKDLLEPYEVFCEHATSLCRLNPEEHDLFKSVTGSEYIFYNLMKEGKKKPVCFDNRIDSNLPSMLEESAMIQFFERETFENDFFTLRVIVVRLNEIIQKLGEMQPMFRAFYKDQFQVFMQCISTQFSILIKSMSRGEKFMKEKGFFLPGLPNYAVVCHVGSALCTNIKKLCSAYVDINLFVQLGRSGAKKIVVFTGASHAYRLLTIVLKKKAEIVIPLKPELEDAVKFVPEGSIERELQFLQLF